MNLGDLYTDIASRTGLSTGNATQKAIILRSANNQLKPLFTKLGLEAEKGSATLTTTADTATYVLDARFLRALKFSEIDTPAKLKYMSLYEFEKNYPSSTETGVPQYYIPTRKIRVAAQPTSASVIALSSDSASDVTSYYVVVRGISNGLMTSERVLLTGATPVNTTNSYTSLLAITKDTTNGTVTATSNSAAVTNIAMPASETEREMWEIKLWPTPDDAYSISYTFQYIPWAISYDEDVVSIPDIYREAYLARITADILFQLGDNKSLAWKADANKMLEEVEDSNFMSKEDDMRFGFENITYNEWE